MTITEFLLARIAEDEAVARAAQSPRGAAIYTDPRRGGKQAMLDHIARYDPARVLAECDAKRRIVELHVPDPNGECDRCFDRVNTGPGEYLFEDWPCATILALAAPYADHPGFNPEWAA